ncbi:MAG: FAD-binding oxidoreductase [Planctomycetes bacterium]|nr:FAD-binding oxidoreductase [Planctomycetota bacterium]MBI3843567.1 FAD-binding oxidoreductase [Planctomycetota bacterium]
METADIVVIGAGVVGASVAFHLAARRAGRIIVLEKEAMLGLGSTSKSAGGVRHQFATEVNVRLSMESIRFFETFDLVMDYPIEFRQWGYLLFTASEKKARVLRTNFELHQRHGLPVEWLSRDDLAARAPYIRTDDLVAGTFCAKDGYLDPAGVLQGFAKQARQLGAEIRLGVEATGVMISGSRIEGVETSAGPIATRCVIDAAGPSAARVAKFAGVDIPVFPIRRMLVCTDRFDAMPARLPMVIDCDSGFHFRREGNGLLMGWEDPDEKPSDSTTFDPSFIEKLLEPALDRAPLLESARVDRRRAWAGLYPETPDHHPLLGRMPGIEGFVLAVGFGGHGVMHSPATGKVIAEVVLDGAAQTVDIRPLRPERFAEGDVVVEPMVF